MRRYAQDEVSELYGALDLNLNQAIQIKSQKRTKYI